MARRALLLPAVVVLLAMADASTKAEPPLPTTLTWIGPADGKWSDPANWMPAKIPGNQDTVIFDGAKGNTASVMDRRHIAKLEIHANYTQTITLQNTLIVDVLNMAGGTIDGAQKLIIWQRTLGQADPATKFENSFFTGGTIKANTFAYGDSGHELTLVLAKLPALTPQLEANFTADAFTSMRWEKNNITVSGGTTIAIYGHFIGDSPGTIGNGAKNWNLDVMTGGQLARGSKAKFDHGIVQSKGGTISSEDVTFGGPGGGKVFTRTLGPGRQEEHSRVELKGVLSEGPYGPELTVNARDVYDLDLQEKPKLKGEALQKLYGKRGLTVTGTLILPSDRLERLRILVSGIQVEVTGDE